MKLYLLILFFCLTTLNQIQGQGKPVIAFAETNCDFGSIKEETGKVTHEFRFTNTGNAPLIIQNVKASCGCTTPTWTKNPVAPGAKGIIAVTYNASGRPGAFIKTITVFNNSVENPATLTIRGKVTEKALSPQQLYPFELGVIRAKSNIVAVGSMIKGEIKSACYKVLNSSKDPVTLSVAGLPKHISASVQPSIVQPDKEATITFTYNTNRINDWSIRNDKVTLLVNNNAAASKTNILTIAAYIAEDFSKLSVEARKNAPAVKLETQDIKLGKIRLNGKLSGTVSIKNTGASPLLLRKAFCDCNCISFQLPKQGIAPGKTTVIPFRVAVGALTGLQFQTVNIVTNSPSTPTIHVRVEWETSPNLSKGGESIR